MRFLLLALLTILIICQSFVTAQETDEVRPLSLKVVTFKGFAMQGTFEGEYRVFPDAIELKINRADFFLADHTAYRGSRRLGSVGFGLATLTADGKKFQRIKTSQSQPLDIQKVMRPLDRYALTNLYFSIPKDATTDLSKAWIVAALSVDHLELFEGKPMKSGFSYAHSCQNIFTLANDGTSCIKRF